jgi:hypothetical protein
MQMGILHPFAAWKMGRVPAPHTFQNRIFEEDQSNYSICTHTT